MTVSVPDFSAVRLLVVGDLMLDRYWHGSTSRISPEAPVPVVHVQTIEERPGGAGNVALNVASLGGQCDLLGVTGNDEAAQTLEQSLKKDGIHCHFQKMDHLATVTKLRVISRHQQLIRLDFEQPELTFDNQAFLQAFAAQLPDCDLVVCSDYAKGGLKDIQTLIQMARQAGKPVLVDPKANDFSIYRDATVIKPNQSEFEAIIGRSKNEQEFVQKAEQLRQDLGLEALLITRSEKGMTLVQKDQESYNLPTRARDVFDVTGAGDTVMAMFATALASGKNMREACQLANVAAGIVVAKLGTASVFLHELEPALKEQEVVEQGVVEENALLSLVRASQAKGETVVMTNGCFDILHAGHVSYLQQAKQMGDRLIVAVNDDASVQRLKGEGRPVNGLHQRMQVLAALGAVDWVVPFSEDTPENLICKLLPNILVKGGDYKVEDIAGAECVIKQGGEVRILDFVEGVSTTHIINTIKG